MVNGNRLWNNLMKLSEIGKTEEGGISRFSFTKEDFQARAFVKERMQEAGLEVREDPIGNVIGRKEGTDDNAEPILMGSHLDTVYNGGSFDGALGVIAGIEVMHSLKENQVQLMHPVEVIAFLDEEGARFSSGMLGSHAIAGVLTEKHLKLKDSQGKTLEMLLSENGYSPETVFDASRKDEKIKAYLELHVEQGKVLEAHNASVGIVTGIAGPLWIKFKIEGKEGHAGSTPMKGRKDALAAGAEIIQLIEKEAASTDTTVGTVGTLRISPGGVNIIPGYMEFTLDLRDVSPSVRDGVEEAIRKGAEAIKERRNLGLEMEVLQNVPPVECDELLQKFIEESMKEQGFNYIHLSTGAAHDANQMSRISPVGMIFVRSPNGMSHSPEEWSRQEDCVKGADVLYHTLIKTAEISRRE